MLALRLLPPHEAGPIPTYASEADEADGLSQAAQTVVYDLETLDPRVRAAIEQADARQCPHCEGEHPLSRPCAGQLAAEAASLAAVAAERQPAPQEDSPDDRNRTQSSRGPCTPGGGEPPWWRSAAVQELVRLGIFGALVAIAVLLAAIGVLALVLYVRLTVGV